VEKNGKKTETEYFMDRIDKKSCDNIERWKVRKKRFYWKWICTLYLNFALSLSFRNDNQFEILFEEQFKGEFKAEEEN
jgi:hypothetical protein